MTTPSRTCSRCGYTNGVLGDFNFAVSVKPTRV